MKPIHLPFVLGLALSLGPGPARGEETVRPAPPAEDLILEALSRSPAIAAKNARLDAARQMEEPTEEWAPSS